MRILLMMMSSIALLFGCATYTPGGVPKEAKTLNVGELRAVFDRAARESLVFDDGYSGGLRFRFEPDGRLEVRSRFVPLKAIGGRWRLSGEPAQLCTQVERDPEMCNTVYQLAGDRYYVDVPTLSAEANTFTLRPR
jgi:hypothetical protein